MATSKDLCSYSRNAGANLSAKLFFLAKVDTDGDIVLAGSAEAALGVITEAAAENSPVTVQTHGFGKVSLGATVAAGARVQSDTNGQAITLSGGVSVGMALEGGNANEIIEVALNI